MGYALHREVHAYLDDPRSFLDGKPVTHPELVIAIEVAIAAVDETRNCRRFDRRLGRWVPTMTVEFLTQRARCTEQVVSVRLRQLSRRGLELRKVLRKDANGAPMYAYKGHATEFWVPPLPTVGDE